MSPRDIPWVIEPQTKIKHQLLDDYIGGWFSIMFSNQAKYGYEKKLVYVDGFSGPGEYWCDDLKKDKTPGSPILIAERANKFLEADRSRKFIMICVDNDKKCVSHLGALLKALNKFGQGWEVYHKSFEESMGELFDYLDEQKANIAPAFFFVDPFGYGGFSMKTMARILKHQRTEVFINFMHYDITRFLDAGHSQGILKDLFDTDEYKKASSMNSDDKTSFLMNLYCDQLRRVAKASFILPFRMNTPSQGTRPRYFLIHASQHIKALKVMKNTMASNSSQPFRFEAIGIGSDRQLDLFRPSDEERLEQRIYEFLAEHKEPKIPYMQCEDWAYQHTPGIDRDIKKALVAMEKVGTIVIERKARQQKTTVTNGAMILRPSNDRK